MFCESLAMIFSKLPITWLESLFVSGFKSVGFFFINVNN